MFAARDRRELDDHLSVTPTGREFEPGATLAPTLWLVLLCGGQIAVRSGERTPGTAPS